MVANGGNEKGANVMERWSGRQQATQNAAHAKYSSHTGANFIN
jgi:hypothetical protein